MARSRLCSSAAVVGAILLLVAASSLAAQQTRLTLRGTVVDSLTGSPVAAALVRLQEPGRTVLTDAEGGFAFRNLKPGSYTLQATGLGYGERSVQVALAEGAPALALTLAARPYTLKPLLAFDSSQARTLGCSSWRSIRYVAIGPEMLAAAGNRDLRSFLDSLSGKWGPFQVVYARVAHGQSIVYLDDVLQFPVPTEVEWLRTRGLARMELYDRFFDRGPKLVRLYTPDYLQHQARDPLTLIWLCPENGPLAWDSGLDVLLAAQVGRRLPGRLR